MFSYLFVTGLKPFNIPNHISKNAYMLQNLNPSEENFELINRSN